MTAPSRQPRIVMMGTARGQRGGVATVVELYHSAGLFAGEDVEYLPTHCRGGVARKAAVAARAAVALTRRLIARRVAAVHLHTSSGASFWRKALYAALARAAGVPYLIHLHGGRFVEFFGQRPQWQRRLIVGTLAHARGVIVLSSQWSERVAAIAPGVRTFVLPNPVRFPATPAFDGRDAATVLFLGQVTPQKGVFDLVHAVAMIGARVPSAQLVIGGTGCLAEVLDLAARLGIGQRVCCLGWLDHERKSHWLSRSAVLALPSHAEAQPMVVLEAMAIGLPVVATRVGGLPELVSDLETGLLVDPGDRVALSDALARLLTDRRLARELAVVASERIACHALDAVVGRLRSIYHSAGVLAPPDPAGTGVANAASRDRAEEPGESQTLCEERAK